MNANSVVQLLIQTLKCRTNFATVPGSGCNKWIQVFNPDSGVVTQARVIDSCGAQVNSSAWAVVGTDW